MGCWSSKKDQPLADFQTNLVRQQSDMVDYDEQFKEGASLGEGITGSVCRVRAIATGKEYAMKSINLEKVNKSQVKELKTEIDILKQLDHPNIVHLHQVYQNKNNIKVIMELLTGGDLSERSITSERQVQRVILQLVSACRYCHSRGVVHRDLKLQNVLYIDQSEDSDIKTIDFGLGGRFMSDELMYQIAQQRKQVRDRSYSFPTRKKTRSGDSAEIAVQDGDSTSNPDNRKSLSVDEQRKMSKSRIFQTTCGTAYYMAPEILYDDGYTEKCDLWAIGVITYMLIVKHPPFMGKSQIDVFRRIRESNPDYKEAAWNSFSADAMEFVRHLLVGNPKKRWTAQQALDSNWMQKFRMVDKESTSSLELSVVASLSKFTTYSKLKRMAMMVIAHNQPSSHIVNLDRLFSNLDKKKLGHFTLAALTDFLSSCDETIGEAKVHEIFESMDQSSMGTIRRMEFLAASMESIGMITVGMVYEAFDHLDLKKNDCITMKEIKKLCGKTVSKREANMMIHEINIDGDKRISKNTFLKFMIDEEADDDDYFSAEEEVESSEETEELFYPSFDEEECEEFSSFFSQDAPSLV